MEINFFLLVLWGFLQRIWSFTFRTQQRNNVFPSRDKILQGKFSRNPACIYILPVQPVRISHSFLPWSDWLTHPVPGICKGKAGSCHTSVSQPRSHEQPPAGAGIGPFRKEQSFLNPFMGLDNQACANGERWGSYIQTRVTRARDLGGIWDLRNTSRLQGEPRPVHGSISKSPELLLLLLHQPQPCSACDVTL